MKNKSWCHCFNVDLINTKFDTFFILKVMKQKILMQKIFKYFKIILEIMVRNFNILYYTAHKNNYINCIEIIEKIIKGIRSLIFFIVITIIIYTKLKFIIFG